MGSTASRAKRVAPALETQNNALEPTNLEGGRFFSSSKAPTSDPGRSLQDSVSEGRGSVLLTDEEEEEVEKILGECENPDSVLSRRLFQRAFFSSKTCGLCYGQGGVTTKTNSRGDIRLVHSEAVSRDHHSSKDRKEMCHKPVGVGREDPVYTKAARVPGHCEHPSLALPVFYDASEEDLMNIIEREFG